MHDAKLEVIVHQKTCTSPYGLNVVANLSIKPDTNCIKGGHCMVRHDQGHPLEHPRMQTTVVMILEIAEPKRYLMQNVAAYVGF
jgi:signal recognition particle subunit SEC65